MNGATEIDRERKREVDSRPSLAYELVGAVPGIVLG